MSGWRIKGEHPYAKYTSPMRTRTGRRVGIETYEREQAALRQREMRSRLLGSDPEAGHPVDGYGGGVDAVLDEDAANPGLLETAGKAIIEHPLLGAALTAGGIIVANRHRIEGGISKIWHKTIALADDAKMHAEHFLHLAKTVKKDPRVRASQQLAKVVKQAMKVQSGIAKVISRPGGVKVYRPKKPSVITQPNKTLYANKLPGWRWHGPSQTGGKLGLWVTPEGEEFPGDYYMKVTIPGKSVLARPSIKHKTGFVPGPGKVAPASLMLDHIGHQDKMHQISWQSGGKVHEYGMSRMERAQDRKSYARGRTRKKRYPYKRYGKNYRKAGKKKKRYGKYKK